MQHAPCYPDKAPKVDQFLDTLSDNICREICLYFEDCSSKEAASLGELVSHIDNRIPGETPPEIRTNLHHVHLPKLAKEGWLEYETPSNSVRYYGHDHAEQFLSELLDVFERE